MQFDEVLKNRRAINFFDTEKDVPEELFRQVVTDAANTPSSFNLQPWNMIVLRDLDDKVRLRKLAMEQPKVSEAPIVCIVLADKNGWRSDHPTQNQNFEEMLKAGSMKEAQRDWFNGACANLYGRSPEAQQAFAVKNTGFFAMSLMYAAAAHGLHTHPMDGFDHDAVQREFGIPNNYWIPLLLAVGYLRPGETIAPPKWRKNYDEIVVRFDTFNPS